MARVHVSRVGRPAYMPCVRAVQAQQKREGTSDLRQSVLFILVAGELVQHDIDVVRVDNFLCVHEARLLARVSRRQIDGRMQIALARLLPSRRRLLALVLRASVSPDSCMRAHDGCRVPCRKSMAQKRHKHARIWTG